MHLAQQVTNAAKNLFKMTQQTKAFKGKSRASIIASCIFITAGKQQPAHIQGNHDLDQRAEEGDRPYVQAA
jgi:transcription initiation factor TFIIIB Brf1 subunit/transcription initiation factor TFIIB